MLPKEDQHIAIRIYDNAAKPWGANWARLGPDFRQALVAKELASTLLSQFMTETPISWAQDLIRAAYKILEDEPT